MYLRIIESIHVITVTGLVLLFNYFVVMNSRKQGCNIFSIKKHQLKKLFPKKRNL